MGCTAVDVKRPLLYFFFFLAGIVMPCREAAGEYAVNQDIRQTKVSPALSHDRADAPIETEVQKIGTGPQGAAERAQGGTRKATATISENAAHLRAKPSLESSPVTWAAKGTVFEVTGEHKEDNGRKWYRVKAANGREYWIVGKVVKVRKEQKREAEEGGRPQAGAQKALAKKPGETKPEPAKPEAAKPEVVKPEALKPEGARSEAKTPDAAKQEEKSPVKAEPGITGKMLVTVTSNAATLRAQPSSGSGAVTWTKKGIVFEVLERTKDNAGKKWYKVKAQNGKTGWLRDIVVKAGGEEPKKGIPEDKPLVGIKPETKEPGTERRKGQALASTEPMQTEKRIVTIVVNSAVLRTKPSFDSEKAAKVSKGTVMEVVDEAAGAAGNKWYKVKTAKGKEYWLSDNVANISPFSLIDGSFVKVEPGDSEHIVIKERAVEELKGKPDGKAVQGEQKKKRTITITNEFAILRAEPSQEGKVIAWAPKGAVFDVIGEFKDTSDKKWYKVKSSKDIECWIAGAMVSLSTSRIGEKEGKGKDSETAIAAEKGKKSGKKEQVGSRHLQELMDKSSVLYKEGKCGDFIAVTEEAIKIASGQKDAATEGTLHYNVAECYALLNKYKGAVQHLDRAIDIAGRTKNPELEILSFIGKNRVLIISGDRKNAAEIFRKISEKADREVFFNIAARDSLKATVAFHMTHILLDIGDEGRARERLDYAFLVNHDFKMEDDIIRVLKIANPPVYEEIAGIDKMLEDAWSSYERGDYRGMEKYSRQSLDGATKMYYKRGIFNGNYYLAMALSNLGESRDAIIHVQNARELAERGADESGLGMVYNLMGNIFKQENEYEKALYYSGKYLEIVKKLGDMNGQAVALNNIGNVMMDKGEYKQALKYYEDSLKIILGAGADRHLIAQGYLSLGRAQKKLGDYNRAGESIALAKNIFSELGNVGGELTGLWELAGNYGLQGEYGPAIKILEDNLNRSEEIGLRQNFVDDLISYAEKSHDSERSEKYRKMKGN